MKNLKSKELIICILAVLALVFVITSETFATTVPSITSLANNSATNNTTGNNVYQEEKDNTILNTKTNNTVQNNTNVNKNVTNSNTLSDTGIETTSVFVLIVVAISAVYAYKKIKEYNV